MKEYSKALLVMIEALGLGSLGLDRLYMNCPGTAALKLLAFVIGLLVSYIDFAVGGFFLLCWALWAIFDYVLVFVNALLKRECSPFCKAAIKWTDTGFSMFVTILFIGLDLVALGFGVYAFGPFALL